MKILLKFAFGLFGLGLMAGIWYWMQPQEKSASAWETVDFSALPNWDKLNHQKSLTVWQKSCRIMLKQPSSTKLNIGPQQLVLGDFAGVCQQALALGTKVSSSQARNFFEQQFIVKHWRTGEALLTGYYSPEYQGQLHADKEYQYPIYAPPKDLITLKLKDFVPKAGHKMLYGKLIDHRLKPYDSREQIAQGSLTHRARILAWVKDPMDALELEIQGSGVIRTPEKTLILNYAAQNGHPYQAIGRVLIEEGYLRKQEVTMNRIRRYFSEHPDQVTRLFKKNPSFVFFKEVSKPHFMGSQNIDLTPGYSLAVDLNYVAMGTPVFIASPLPNHKHLHRLLIAQDVGGAIKGKQRADIYWGQGLHAQQLAGEMKQLGQMWFFLPRPSTRGFIQSVI